MHRDIRSFFSVKKAKKPVEDNDSDVIPESPKLPTVNKKKQSRKRRQIQEDSDEEIFSPPKINKNEPKPALKEVKAVDIFGSAPIKRSKPIVKKSKKETETGIHSDEEFEKSLLQLDEVDNSVCSKLLLKNNIVSKVDIIDKSKEQSIKHIDLKDKLNPTSINKKDKESIVYKKGENNHTNLEKIPVSKNPNLRHRKVNRKDKKNLDTMKTDQQIVDTTVHDSNDKSTEEIIQKENESTSQKRNEDEIDHDQTTIPDKKSKEKNQDSNDNSSKQITKNEKESTSHKRKLDKCDKDMNIDEKAEKIRKEKVDFSEFLINEETNFDTDKSNEPKQKRAKLDKSLNDSVLTDEERHERKRHSAALYKNYLNRSGPKHLGSKEIPEGLPGCLKNCAFLLTGVLDSFERDEVIAAIMKYGGRVKPGISKKVTHVIAGEDAGPAKLAKAEELGIKIINEDDFLKMIKDSMVGRNTFHFKEIKKENKPEMKESNVKESTLGLSIDTKETDVSSTTVLNKEPKIEKDANEVPQKISNPADNSNLMWVDKYKPTILRQIIGQHGERSNVIKLSSWLTQWYVNRKAKIPKPSPWARDDNGAYYKAALLSGPPGVGKTTTVSLVCKELGFDMVEFNASDTRSKTLIRSQIGELLSTTSLSAYARGKGAVSKKHVLVMDEVDGMAGNEDRGGLQELISLIKSTSVPVICMCNDRSSEKMRTLVNYCYDLRFERPRVNQIMCAMLSICYKEGVKVPNTVITQLIEAAGRDVRQTLHMLSVWVSDSNLMDGDRLKQEAGKVKKDIKMGPWEAIRRVFSADEHQKMSIHDKSDLFFADYNIMPLYVQENYLNVVPHKHGKTAYSKRETLERLSRAADSISSGDLVDARIRRKQSWNLLPVQAMFSSVIPGHEMEGHIAGQIQFPGWLGKNSRANKMRRLAQEIHAHTRLSTSGSKSSIFLDYSTHLRDAILSPLIQDKIDGIERSLRVLESYNLIREDIDSLVELSQWPGKSNPTALIEPRVKAALTRTYNKTASALPYAPGAVKKGARGIEDSENSQEDYDEVEVDSDPENDTLIKKVKPKEKAGPNNASGTGKKSASSSQSKGNNGAKSNTKR